MTETAVLEPGTEEKVERKVEKGMLLLLYRNEPNEIGREAGIPVRFELLTVSAVRRSAKAARVTLLSHTESGVIMEATATFPDGAIRPPFKLFVLSERDLAYAWDKLA